MAYPPFVRPIAQAAQKDSTELWLLRCSSVSCVLDPRVDATRVPFYVSAIKHSRVGVWQAVCLRFSDPPAADRSLKKLNCQWAPPNGLAVAGWGFLGSEYHRVPRTFTTFDRYGLCEGALHWDDHATYRVIYGRYGDVIIVVDCFERSSLSFRCSN